MLIDDSHKNRFNIGHFLIVALFIFISDDTVMFGTNANSNYIIIKYIYIVVAGVVLLCYSFMKPRLRVKSGFGYFSVLIMFLVTSMVFNQDYRFGYVFKICLLIYAISIVRIMRLDEFACYFCKIMVFIATVSIIGFFIVVCARSILYFFPIITNTANTNFYNTFIYVAPTYYYSEFVRNYGVFREPGVYQMFLIMALLFEVNILKNHSVFRYGIYFVAIITTMSTTGYIALGLVIILIIIDKQGLTFGKKCFIVGAISGVFIALCMFTSIFSFSPDDQFNSVFGKLNNTNRASTVARLGSITENIHMMIEKPLFGVGLTGLYEKFPIYTLQKYGRESIHNTNTFLIQFASHGLVYGMLWVFAYWKFSKKLNSNKTFMIFIIILILYIGENLTYSCFSSLFLAFGIMTIDDNRLY